MASVAAAGGVVFFSGAGSLPSIRRATVGGRQRQRQRRPLSAAAATPFRNGSPPETDCPVPPEQQPVNEYQTLAASLPFSWAAADLPHFGSRLLLLGGSFALFLGLPVAWFGVVDPHRDPLKTAVAAAAAGFLAATFVVLRIYLGWAYVGNRLLSATVEYEETGWYDGQIWVKTPEVLARDRLLGSFSVKPVLSRVKYTLIGLAISLFVCVVLFVNLESPKSKKLYTDDASGTGVPRVYNDDSARTFEPDAFCGEPNIS